MDESSSAEALSENKLDDFADDLGTSGFIPIGNFLNEPKFGKKIHKYEIDKFISFY